MDTSKKDIYRFLQCCVCGSCIADFNSDQCTACGCKEILDFTNNAIKKQTAKHPYINKHETKSAGICMTCGKNFLTEQNYCSYCGQKQDWKGI